jgi:dCTP deaminase
LDLSKPIELPPYVEHICESFILLPGEFILGCTMEHIKLPADIQATVCGKSSLGRLGLFVENAGFVDPGFNGFLTLELFNASKTPLKLCAGMRIAQLSFNRLDTPCQRPYGAPELGSHYQNQTGATVSRWEPR